MKKESIYRDFFLTLVTFGFWNIYVQIRQITDCNELIGKEKHNFLKMILFSIFTLGLFFAYHEYVLCMDLQEKLYGRRNRWHALWVFPMAILGIWPTIDSYQQLLLNASLEGKEKLSGKDVGNLVTVSLLYTVFIIGVLAFAPTLIQ